MRDLREFRLTLKFPAGALEVKTIASLVAYLQTDLFRGKSLAAQVFSDESSCMEAVDGDAVDAFLRAVAAGRRVAWVGSDRSTRGAGVSYGSSSMELPWQAVTVVGYPQAGYEHAFVDVCRLLRPRHGLFVPVYEGQLGAQDDVLEMAVQHRYGIFGYWPDSLDVTRARAIASLLPRIDYEMPDPAGMPSRIGWLNYWHSEVAARFEFPESKKDQRLMPLARQFDDGSWLVKLTAEPLDLERADHVETLAWAYWRFDKIGKRMTPTTKTAKVRSKQSHRDAATNDQSKRYALRERDANGQWWDSAAEPIVAASAEDALRIYFARNAHGRAPKAGESLRKLSAAYDEIAAEVGLTSAENLDAVEVEA
jgi:Family of unknown function (DUF5953)